ncbi:MAG TPA: formylmethanofuran dehydrogenase subunit E family protein [Desulfobacteraceae bacterium]|nr:formylmethanofuran dehydrogenase subunit E family protein [Desulfobacteraceae bacterium]HPJ66525.1 formylmethanofuran dehydrogenase subunit E family protein [Desulfobacteraceae bacterium]HPQ29724.1 formylmethanofuran dehydrogenase subunit E family protein [Desulfobacteraceae bacterium]
MNIGSFTCDEFLEKIRTVHGSTAPGVVLGGIMLDYARRHLPEGCIFDVVCETRSCLPDSVQILTPCSLGNGWLKVIPLGRFALSLFDKYSGKGIRCFLDPAKTVKWPEIHSWFLKLKPKKDQDLEGILQDIKMASFSIYGLQNILVKDFFRKKQQKGDIAICPSCHEAYPEKDGNICLGCQAMDQDAYYLANKTKYINDDLE